MTANILSNLSQNTEALDIARRKTQVASPIREENLYMYHRLLRDENVLKELKELVESVNARKQLFENNFTDYDSYVLELVAVINSRLDYFQAMLDRFESERETTRALVQGSEKKAKRKISYLDAKEGFFSWFFEESFVNYMLLDSTKTQANIDTTAGVASLPINSREEVVVNEIILGRDTKGIVGAPEGGSNRTTNLLANNEALNFSCYSKASEQCVLELEVQLPREQVVNFLSIKQADSSKCLLDKIEAIDFYSSDYTKVSIEEVSGSELRFNESGNLNIYFIPLSVNKISILLRQEREYYSSGEFIKQIDLNDLKLFRLQYDQEGSFETSGQPVNSVLSLSNKVQAFPSVSISDSLTLKVKEGRAYTSLDINQTQSLESYLQLFQLVAELKRPESLTSITTQESRYFEYDTQGAILFNPAIPTSIPVDAGYDKNKIKVAHELSGSIKDSANKVVTLDLDWINCDSDVYYKVVVDNDTTPLTALTNIPVDNSESSKGIKLINCYTEPAVEEEEGWYKLSLGEFFELNSLKISHNDIAIENYKITLDESMISGVAVSKEDLLIQQIERQLSDYPLTSTSYNFDESIIKGSLKFNSGLATGYEPVTFIDGSREFSFLVNQEEFLDSRNVTANSVIAYELDGTPNSSISLYKDGFFLRNIARENDVDPTSVTETTPKLDVSSNVVYLNVGNTNFINGYSVRYSEASSQGTEERFFSVNYSRGTIYFSHPVDDSLTVSYKSSDGLRCEFIPAKYLPYDVDGDYIVVKSSEPISMMRTNLLHTYLGVEDKTVDISGLETYYSPVIHSIKVMGS